LLPSQTTNHEHPNNVLSRRPKPHSGTGKPEGRGCLMPHQYKSTTEIQRTPVIAPGHTFGTVTEKISAIVLTRPASNGWFIGFGLCCMLTMMMMFAIGYLFLKGLGIWGVTIRIGWDFAIVHFMCWFGIGHSGPLISGI